MDSIGMRFSVNKDGSWTTQAGSCGGPNDFQVSCGKKPSVQKSLQDRLADIDKRKI